MLGRAETVAEKSAEAAKQSADVARLALHQTQRAFVFVSKIDTKRAMNAAGQTEGWYFEVEWKNTGNTPTKNLYQGLNIKAFDRELPDDFDFADLDNRISAPAYIPAQTPMHTTLPLAIADVDAVIAGTKKLYIWGWAKYEDIFEGTPEHWVDVAMEVGIAGDSRSDKNVTSFAMYRRHNRHYDKPKE